MAGKGRLRANIVIPAYNEERNIGSLLSDVCSQIKDSWFDIDTIYVVSDASTDGTNQITLGYSSQDSRVKLITKPERKGKWDSLNLAQSLSDTDALVILDADIRLANENVVGTLLNAIWQDGVALVGGNPMPKPPSDTFSLAEQAAYFSWVLLDKIKRKRPTGLYSAHGRILALSRNFYERLVLMDCPAEDQYIYLSCMKAGLKFVYAEDSVVYYKLTKSLADYLKQSVRFRFAIRASSQIFGRDLVADKARIAGHPGVFLSALAQHPYKGFAWIICYSISKIKFLADLLRKREITGVWDTAETDK